MDLINWLVLSAFGINIFLSSLLYFRARKDKSNIMFIITAVSIAFWCLAMVMYRAAPTQPTSVIWAKILYLFPTFIPTAFTLFGLFFPKNHVNKLIIIGVFALNLVISFLTIYNDSIIKDVILVSGQEKQIVFGQYYYAFYNLYITGFFVASYIILFKKYLKADLHTKRQILYILIGMTAASIPAMVTNLNLPTYYNYFELNWAGQLFSIFWVGGVAYAIGKHKLLDIRFVVARTFTYIVVILVLAILYANAFFIFARYIVGDFITLEHVGTSTVMAIVMAFTFQPIRRFLEKSTDKVFYKNHYDTQDLLIDLNELMASTILIEELITNFEEKLFERLKVSRGALLLMNESRITWARMHGYVETPVFDEEVLSQLAKNTDGNTCIVNDLEDINLKNQLHDYGIKLAVFLKVKNELEAILLLGEKASGDLYTPQDLVVLNIIAPEMAIAIRNAESYEEIQRFNTSLQQKIDASTNDMKSITEEVYKKNFELAEVSKSLAEANDKLKALDHLKDEFVSLASHELRTPMTAIKSYLWLFLQYNRTQLNPQEKLYIERAYEATDRLITLVNDMLNVSRIESGRMNLVFKEVDYTKLINEVIDELKPMTEKQKVHIILDAPSSLPTIAGDSNKIREVLINLMGNSLKFTDPDGKIILRIHQDNDMIITDVTDTGKGIKKEDLAKLFQKFGIVGNNYLQKQNSQGTGLGLYISKSIVQLHGGTIWANSEGENKGTTFSFTLKQYKGEPVSTDNKILPKPMVDTDHPVVSTVA